MKDYFKKLFDYNNWANKEIADSLLSLNDPPEKAMSLMSHILNAQIIWLCRIKNIATENIVWKEYSQKELAEVLKKSSDELTDYINSISDNDIEKIIDYANTKGEKFQSQLEDILAHITYHSAYHRGQIIPLIKPFVKELPVTDYIHFARAIKNS